MKLLHKRELISKPCKFRRTLLKNNHPDYALVPKPGPRDSWSKPPLITGLGIPERSPLQISRDSWSKPPPLITGLVVPERSPLQKSRDPQPKPGEILEDPEIRKMLNDGIFLPPIIEPFPPSPQKLTSFLEEDLYLSDDQSGLIIF